MAASVKKKSNKPKGNLPPSCISRVLLHDNQLEANVLENKMARISTDRNRANRLLGMQKQTFVVQQACKEQELRDMGLKHSSFLPEIVMKMTAVDVEVRKPLAKTRKSASYEFEQMMTNNIFSDESQKREKYTQIHGVDLRRTLGGRRYEAPANESYEKNKEKCLADPRYQELVKSLYRKEKQLWEILGEPAPEKNQEEDSAAASTSDPDFELPIISKKQSIFKIDI